MNHHSKFGKTFWFDLPVSDVVNARSFYEGLFGWKFLLLRDASFTDYWVIEADQELIGGIRKMPGVNATASGPVLYFTVEDLPSSSHRVKELGGTLVGDPVRLGNNGGSYQWFFDREKNLVALWAPSKESV